MNISKLLWSCSKKYLLLLIAINILIGFSTPAKLLIWKNIIDEATQLLTSQSNEFNLIIMLLGLYFTIGIITDFLGQLTQYVKKIYSEYLNKNITQIMIDKVSEMDLIQFDDSKIYDDIQKVNEESVTRISQFLDIIIQFINYLIQLVSTAAILISFSSLITLLCICTTTPMFYLSIKLLNTEFSLYNKRFEKKRLVTALKSILIKNENIKEIKIYGISSYFKNFINSIFEQYIQEDKVIRKNYLKKFTLGISLESIFSYAIKLYTFIVAIRQRCSIGTITMYISTIESFQGCIANILGTIQDLYENKLYTDSLFSILDLHPIYKNNTENKRIFDGNFEVIELKNVWFKYPNKDEYALKNINLKIYSKKSYSLVGMNGSGKTTLIKLLSMLYLPNKGDIYIDGINIKEYDKTSIYTNIGIVFQDFIRYPLDVSKNIGLGSINDIEDIEKIKKSAEKSGASQFIDGLPQKYKTQLQKEWTDGVDLSLGQWQKLSISRAFMADRSILILDEPTASLDAAAEYEIFKSFKEMIEGKTCILISHRFSTVKLADEIIVIKDGEIIEQGTHEELSKYGGLYEQLYNMQAKCYV